MKSSDLLPTTLTREPSRIGLVYYEILADGLIHSAAVLGIEPDERFVERVATLAWSNGAKLVQRHVSAAANIIRQLAESLESGRSETDCLCRALAVDVVGAENAFHAIRSHYAEKQHCRALNLTDPGHSGQIRRLVAEAALGGLLSRGLLPDLYFAITGQVRFCQNQESFLATRLWTWASCTKSGLPRYHPIIDLACLFYETHPLERNLVCESLGSDLNGILDQSDPWALELWLLPAWRHGIEIAQLAPDEIDRVVEELDDEERATNLRIYRECVESAGATANKDDLVDSFLRYLTKWNPYGFADENIRAANLRMLAVRAYDFAIWMAIVSVRPAALAAKGGAA